MLKQAFLLLAFFTLYFSGYAQEFEEELSNYTPPSELMRQIQLFKDDSDKVKSLLSLSKYYMFYGHDLDSAMAYVQKTLLLSERIGYQSGMDDATFYLCKLYASKKNVPAAQVLLGQVKPDKRVRLLITIGEHYLFNTEQSKGDPDSAAAWFSRAMVLAATLPSDKWKQECLISMAKYYYSTGDLKKANETFQKVIDHYHRSGERQEEADTWYQILHYIPQTDSLQKDLFFAAEQALGLYRKTKDTLGQINVLTSMGWVTCHAATSGSPRPNIARHFS